MEDLLAQERATEQHVLTLLKTADVSASDLLAAFDYYRALVEATSFADFQNAEPREMRLWHTHGEGKKYFSKKLRDHRKRHADKVVEDRQLTKSYLEFLKQSERFYRGYLFKVNKACGGIPELENVAQMATREGFGESQPDSLPSLPLESSRASAHRSLIFLGDLQRYRASEELEKTPNYGGAIGYYHLAAVIVPSSGLGHHQQAVVALDNRNHLRAIYHLYRSIAVPEPHPHALGNLGKEFEKTNAAWDRGELIQKGPPNDPDASKRALVGWFIRLHSMCYKGEPFRGHDELEREVLSQLSNVIRQRPLDETLQRMILTNMGAQWVAGEKFQGREQNYAHRENRTDTHRSKSI